MATPPDLITVSDLIQGPATVYYATWSAAGVEPTAPASSAVATAPSSAVWTPVGGTRGGVQLQINQTFVNLDLDQIVDVPDVRRTARDWMVTASLAQITLENLKMALNGGTVTSGTGYKELNPDAGMTETQIDYLSILFDGYAPGFGQKRRRVIMRKCVSVESIALQNNKTDQQVMGTGFRGLWVDTTRAPVYFVDQTT